MAFKLTKQSETHTWYTSGEALWLTDDGRVVAAGDPAAAFLFAAEGSQISVADAERYGLVGGAKQAEESTNPDDDLKAAEWVELVEAVETTDALEALQARYEQSAADFKTVSAALEKKTDELTSG